MLKLIFQNAILINTPAPLARGLFASLSCGLRRPPSTQPPSSSGLPSFATEKLSPISLAAASSASTWV